MCIFQCLTGKCNTVEQLLWQYIKNAHKYLGNREIQNKINSCLIFDLFAKIPELQSMGTILDGLDYYSSHLLS